MNGFINEKAIKHGKEKRKPYRKSKSVDKTCRNHGSCPYCKDNREYKNIKRVEVLKEREKDDIL